MNGLSPFSHRSPISECYIQNNSPFNSQIVRLQPNPRHDSHRVLSSKHQAPLRRTMKIIFVQTINFNNYLLVLNLSTLISHNRPKNFTKSGTPKKTHCSIVHIPREVVLMTVPSGPTAAGRATRRQNTLRDFKEESKAKGILSDPRPPLQPVKNIQKRQLLLAHIHLSTRPQKSLGRDISSSTPSTERPLTEL